MAAEDFFPGAIVDLGLNAGYRRGRTLNTYDVAHFTVGRDSWALIRDRGLAAFLFPKIGRPGQFCEANSITSHACESNDDGCGYEVERLNWEEPFTPDQTYWVGEVVRWRHARYGVPLEHWPAALGRLPVVNPFRGVADHGGLVHRACDQHTDGWWPSEWAAAIGSSSTPDQPDNDRKEFFLMDTYPTAVLADGSVLTVGHGVGSPVFSVFAHLADKDGKTLSATLVNPGGWHALGGRIYDSPQLTVDPSGTRVHITASGDEGNPDLAGSYNVPFRNVYVHDTAKAFDKRFLGWKPMGNGSARIRPAIAPGV